MNKRRERERVRVREREWERERLSLSSDKWKFLLSRFSRVNQTFSPPKLESRWRHRTVAWPLVESNREVALTSSRHSFRLLVLVLKKISPTFFISQLFFLTQTEVIELVLPHAAELGINLFSLSTHSQRCTSLRDLIKDNPMVKESGIRTHNLLITRWALYCCATPAAQLSLILLYSFFSFGVYLPHIHTRQSHP